MNNIDVVSLPENNGGANDAQIKPTYTTSYVVVARLSPGSEYRVLLYLLLLIIELVEQTDFEKTVAKEFGFDPYTRDCPIKINSIASIHSFFGSL